MRCYQEIGLTLEAAQFIEQNSVVIETCCPLCRNGVLKRPNILSYIKEDIFYGEGPVLNTYKLKDGTIIKEIIQEILYSSGPVAFLCLEQDGKKMFEWSEREIRDYL